MATPWPEDQNWPTPYREHAAKLSRYLQAALKSIDNANGQPIQPQGVRVAVISTLSLLVKLQNVPDIDHIHHAIENLNTETRNAGGNTIRTATTMRVAIQQNTAEIKENTNLAKAANATAKEALEASKMILKMVRDMKAPGPMIQGNNVSAAVQSNKQDNEVLSV
ncbi:hypothetical protein CPLU01_15845 [Colletotrichum plurivorum]|uniref:Uncharacterized protein n=1 Tax=Colletotrichum plurivorum TaxID=2175906 RepID=A0A8H6MSY8_9PEZI|nr:hypothetical protein CPLU01_15845 [Colletotrichum plurivorum]